MEVFETDAGLAEVLEQGGDPGALALRVVGVDQLLAAVRQGEAMRGELDYPQSLRKRVGLLKNLPETALARVYDERLKLTPGAEALISACKKHSVKLLLVSGGFTFFTERLKGRLGLDYTISNTLEIHHGRLTGNLSGGLVDAQRSVPGVSTGMFAVLARAATAYVEPPKYG